MLIEFDSERDSLDNIINDNSTVILYLTSKTCRPCVSYGPVIAKIAQDFGVTIVKIDIDKSPGIADQYTIFSVPTLIQIRDGEVVKTIIGAKPKAFVIKEFGFEK